MGFPAESLPPAGDPGIPTNTLRLPLDPFADGDLIPEFAYSPARAGPFKGGELIASITAKLIDIWQSTADDPILQKQEDHFEPFWNIVQEVRPALLSPRAVLTPLGTGIVYCWMIRRVLDEQTWPGHITASIYTEDRGEVGLPLGAIYVENKPQRNVASTLMSSKNSTGLEAGGAPAGKFRIIIENNDADDRLSVVHNTAFRERSWLSVFLQMLFFVLKKPPSARLRNPADSSININFPSSFDPKLRGILTISRYTEALPWKVVAEVMLSLSVMAARADRWEYQEVAKIMWLDQEVAKIRFVLLP